MSMMCTQSIRNANKRLVWPGLFAVYYTSSHNRHLWLVFGAWGINWVYSPSHFGLQEFCNRTPMADGKPWRRFWPTNFETSLVVLKCFEYFVGYSPVTDLMYKRFFVLSRLNSMPPVLKLLRTSYLRAQTCCGLPMRRSNATAAISGDIALYPDIYLYKARWGRFESQQFDVQKSKTISVVESNFELQKAVPLWQNWCLQSSKRGRVAPPGAVAIGKMWQGSHEVTDLLRRELISQYKNASFVSLLNHRCCQGRFFS